MTILPQAPTDTAADVATELKNLITLDASILFVVLGQSADAQTLLSLASAQSTTGSTSWTRKVVWVQSQLGAVTDASLTPFLSANGLAVAQTSLAFTIGFGNQVAAIFNPGDSITAYDVFVAYAKAESEPDPAGGAK